MLFRTLYNSDKFAIFSLNYIDEDRILITNSNKTGIRMMTLDENNYKNELLSKYVREIDFNRMKLKLKNSLEEQKHNDIILEFIVDGILTHWHAYIIPIILNESSQILVISVDISMTINKRNKNMKYLKTFFENTTDYLYVLDIDKNKQITMELLNQAKAKSINPNASIEDFTNKTFVEIYGENTDYFLDDTFNKCFKERKVQTTVIVDHKLQCYRDITLTPLIFEDEFKIFVYSKDISETILRQVEKNNMLEDLDFLFQTNTSGMCMLSIENDSTKVIKANNTFYEFLEIFGLSKCKLLNLNELTYVLNEKKPYEGQISINHEKFGHVFYNISIIPKIEEHTISKVYITCVNTTEVLKLSQRLAVRLTTREEEILSLVAQGKSNKLIAFDLNIAEGTVKKTIYRAFNKLNINSRSELIKYFLSDKNLIINENR